MRDLDTRSVEGELVLLNPTGGDGAGARKREILLQGKTLAGVVHTLLRLIAQHEGAAADQKGEVLLYVNDGNDGTAPTLAVTIASTGVVTFAQTPAGLATSAAVAAAISALSSVYQPLDGDLTSIAALTTTAYGRGLLTLANQAALQTEVAAILKAIGTAADSLITFSGAGVPVELPVAASRLIGKKSSGGLDDLTAAEVLTILGAGSASGPALLDANGLIPVGDGQMPFGPHQGTTGFESWLVLGAANTAALTTAATATGTLYIWAHDVPQRCTIDRLALDNTTTPAGNARIVVYAPTSATNLTPNTKLYDSGDISTAAAPIVCTPNLTLDPGIYLIAVEVSVTVTIRTHTVNSLKQILGFPSTLGSAPRQGWAVTHTYGTAPNPFSGVLTDKTTAGIPAVYARFS